MMWTGEMERALILHRQVNRVNHEARLIDQGCEEAAEVAVALLHQRRGRASIFDAIGEFADLWLCMEFLRRSHGISDADFSEMLAARTAHLTEQLEAVRKGQER